MSLIGSPTSVRSAMPILQVLDALSAAAPLARVSETAAAARSAKSTASRVTTLLLSACPNIGSLLTGANPATHRAASETVFERQADFGPTIRLPWESRPHRNERTARSPA